MIPAAVLGLLAMVAVTVWLLVALLSAGDSQRRLTLMLWFILPWAPFIGTTTKAFGVDLTAIPVSALAAAGIVAIAAMIVTARSEDPFPNAAKPIAIASLLMWAAMLICDLGSGVTPQLRPIAGAAALAAVLVTLSKSDAPLAGLRSGLVSICFLSLATGLVRSSVWVFDDPTPKFPVPTPYGGRLAGLAYSPNHLGFLAATALVLHAFGPRPRIPIWATASLSLIVILFSGSRSALIGVVTAGAAAFLIRGRKPIIWWLAAIVGVGSAWLLLGHSLSNGRDLATFNGRQVIWDAVIGSFPSHPIFGFGPGGWRHMVELNHLPGYAVEGHNQVIDTLGKGGLVGLLALGAWLAVAVASALRRTDAARVLPFALLGLIAGRSVFEAPLDIYLLGPATITVAAFAASIAWTPAELAPEDDHRDSPQIGQPIEHASRGIARLPA